MTADRDPVPQDFFLAPPVDAEFNAVVRLVAVMPSEYRDLTPGERQEVRDAYVDQVATAKNETGARRGKRLGRVQSDSTHPWVFDLEVADEYPTNAEMIPKLEKRLGVYNDGLRVGRYVNVRLRTAGAKGTDGPINPVQYVLVEGRIRCIHTFGLEYSEGGMSGAGEVSAGDAFEVHKGWGGSPEDIKALVGIELAFWAKK